MSGSEFYSEEELEIIRQQMREQNRLASELVKKRGIKMDPRCKDLK